jgi:HAD superfamily hydrolase (TIGR01509 family)
MLAAVIFDMDGVLLDSEPLHDVAAVRVFEALGAGAGEDIQADLLAFRGRTERDFWVHLQRKHGLNASLDELIHRKQACFFDILRSEPDVRPFPGLVSLLAAVKASLPLALASSSSHLVIDVTLARLELLDAFTVRVSGVDVARGKPAPDIFLLAAQKLTVPPSQCLVIEDSVSGVAAARAAGMACLGFVGSGATPQQLNAATAVIQTFEGVDIAALRRLKHQ